jgi:hypothetical protein
MRNAVELLTPNRLDIVARIPFAKALISGSGTNWGLHVYRQYLQFMSKGQYGEDFKFSQSDYIQEFCALVKSINVNGFKEEFGFIPLVNGEVNNGAHRVATCIALNLQVSCQAVNGNPEIQNYAELQNRGIPEYLLDYLVLEYVKLKDSARAFVLLDSTEETLRKMLKDFSNKDSILCIKQISLSEIGKRRMIDLMYSHNDWWTFELLERFVNERFNTPSNNCYVLVFDSTGFKDIRTLKETLRTHLSKDEFERKLHGTDGQTDTIQLCETILNSNGLFFLNNSPIGAEHRIQGLISRSGTLPKTLVGSAPLELYGLREARDLDFASTELEKEKYDDRLEISDLFGYNLDADSLNCDPRFFAKYKNLKFAALPSVLFYKGNRMQNKDIEDVRLISNFLLHDCDTYLDSRMRNSAFVLENSRKKLLMRNRITALLPHPVKNLLKSIFKVP